MQDNDPLDGLSMPPRKPYLLAGAGPLTATIWKDGDCHAGWDYRFNIVRTSRTTGRVTQCFAPRNIRHLAKLVQVLAFILADDGCLEPGRRDELKELASRMEMALRGWET